MSIASRTLAAFLIAALIPGSQAFPSRQKKPSSAVAHSHLAPDQRALHLLNRLTFGPRPGDLARVEAIGIDAWIDQQLHPESIDDSALESRLAAYPALQLNQRDLIERFPAPAMIRAAENGRLPIPKDRVVHAVYTDQIARREQNQAAKTVQPATSSMQIPAPLSDGAPQKPAFSDSDAAAIVSLPPAQRVAALVSMSPADSGSFFKQLSRPRRIALFTGLSPQQRETVFALINPQLVVGGEVLATRLLRDLYSARQLEAVMTDFWLNHFNVYLKKGDYAPWYLAEYQDKVIRPHALGKFEDLLAATAHSPAMLFYLDNTESVGPHSIAAVRAANSPQQRSLGLNENYARELMELHTLGVNGGYTQNDVIEVAKVFSGWMIDKPEEGRGFTFNDRRHEPGSKYVLKHTIKEGGENEGLEVLHLLATSHATAHFVSRKLAERFVNDHPPAALVDRMAKTWHKTGGDIREVLRTMLTSPEFWSQDAYRAKIKTPEEYVLSAVRATGGDVLHPVALVEAMAQLGMPFYGCQTPNGYSWKADAWLNSGDLLDRMNFGLALAGNTAGTEMRFDSLLGPADNSPSTPPASPEEKTARLESILLNGVISPRTHAAALDQLSQQPSTMSAAKPQALKPVNFIKGRDYGQMLAAAPPITPPQDRDAAILTGLLLGSPDFQRR